MGSDRRATIVGFAVAVLVLGVLFWLVGVDEILGALGRADRSRVALLVPVAVVWLSAWGLALYTVLRALGTPVAPHTAVLVFTGAVFSNNVTPFGQAGGEPLAAVLISEAADSEYETGLAAIASVDALHFLPSVGLAALGLSVVAVQTVTLGRNLQVAAVAVGALALLITVAAYVGWRHRYELEAVVVRLLTPVVRAVSRVVPRLSPPSPAAIERRIEGFFGAIDRVAADRKTVVLALTFSLVGWLSLATSLWLSALAVGSPVPFTAALVVVPVGSIAGFTPLPGGLGGIETAFVVLLASTAGTPVAAASAAVILHRGATYWLPALVGGGVAAVLGTQRGRRRVGRE